MINQMQKLLIRLGWDKENHVGCCFSGYSKALDDNRRIFISDHNMAYIGSEHNVIPFQSSFLGLIKWKIVKKYFYVSLNKRVRNENDLNAVWYYLTGDLLNNILLPRLKPPVKINILEAITMLQNEIEAAYYLAEAIMGTNNNEVIEHRVNTIVCEIIHYDIFISEIDIKTALRQHFVEINKENRSLYLNEIALKIADLNKKLSNNIYAKPFELMQKVNLKITNAIDTITGEEL